MLASSTADKTKARPLLRAVLKAHWWDVLSILVPRLLFSVCKLAQPFLILHALAAVPKTDLPEASKYALLLETLLIYGGLMVSAQRPLLPVSCIQLRVLDLPLCIYHKERSCNHSDSRYSHRCHI